MLVEPRELAAALGLPGAIAGDPEPIGTWPLMAERVTLTLPGGERRVVVLRGSRHPLQALNHIAVQGALTRRGFMSIARLLAVVDDIAIEEDVEGISALAVVPPPGGYEAAIAAIAALHGQEIYEGARWGMQPEDLLPDEELPLHRLGFAAHERAAASAPLARLVAELRESPFGFVHGNATAANVLIGREQVYLTGFGNAGYGPQLFDAVAFLMTCGLDSSGRAALAHEYAKRRQLDPVATTQAMAAAEVIWGLNELLQLPRRQVEALGDDGATEALRIAANRIERALGGGPRDGAAGAARQALWPE